MAGHVQGCGTALELVGETLMKRQPVPVIGKLWLVAADELESVSLLLGQLSENSDVGNTAAQRCHYAADRMVLAGNSLLPSDNNNDGSKTKVTGKAW